MSSTKYNRKITKYLVGATSNNPTYRIVNTRHPKGEIAINNETSGKTLQINFDKGHIYFTFFERNIYEGKSCKVIKDSKEFSRYFKGEDEETRILGINLLLTELHKQNGTRKQYEIQK